MVFWRRNRVGIAPSSGTAIGNVMQEERMTRYFGSSRKYTCQKEKKSGNDTATSASDRVGNGRRRSRDRQANRNMFLAAWTWLSAQILTCLRPQTDRTSDPKFEECMDLPECSYGLDRESSDNEITCEPTDVISTHSSNISMPSCSSYASSYLQSLPFYVIEDTDSIFSYFHITKEACLGKKAQYVLEPAAEPVTGDLDSISCSQKDEDVRAVLDDILRLVEKECDIPVPTQDEEVKAVLDDIIQRVVDDLTFSSPQ